MASRNKAEDTATATTPANGATNRTRILKIGARAKADKTPDGKERTFSYDYPVPETVEGFVTWLGEDVTRSILDRQIGALLRGAIRDELTNGLPDGEGKPNRLATDAELTALINNYTFSADIRRGRKPMSTVEKVTKKLSGDDITATELEEMQKAIAARLAALKNAPTPVEG